MVSPVIDHTHKQKKHGGNRAVVEHLQNRPIDGGSVAKYRHAKHHKTHVAYTGIGDEFLHILLGHGTKSAIDDAY